MTYREILALKTIGILFVCMGIIAYMQPQEDGYSRRQIHAVNALVANLDAPRFKTRQAMALAEIYDVTDEDLVKPVNLWRKP